MSNIVEREPDSLPETTGNLIDSKVAIKSESKDDPNQGEEQFEHENPDSRFLSFLANLANDELVYVDCPAKSSPHKKSVKSKAVKDETNDSLDEHDDSGKQDKSDKSNVLHKDIDGCGCNFDTDEDEFNFILGNEFDTDDDTDL